MSDSTRSPAGTRFPVTTLPSLPELFRAFVIVSISGFGGALPWARRMIVDQKHWMTADEFNDVEMLSRILTGIAAAATGLLIAVVAKMAAPLFLKRWDWAPLIAIAAFIGVAIMQWPLPWVFAGLAPVSIALAWMKR